MLVILQDEQVGLIVNCVHRSLSYALQRFQATVKHRANTSMQAHGAEASRVDSPDVLNRREVW
jgi:hypothetical protein